MINWILYYAINALLILFVFSRLFGGKKINYECGKRSKAYEVIFFILLGLVMYYRNPNLYGIISLCLFLISGAIYHILPSGLADKAIVVKGKVYPFNKIDDMDLEGIDGECRLNFKYHLSSKTLFTTLEHRDMLKSFIRLYERS